MNFFQQQLKWILGNQLEFQDAKYVGRACFVPLVDGTRIKAELITRGTHEKYEALKLTAMNKAEGQIDATILEFKDYFAAQKGSTAGAFTPHIWIYREKPEWYGAPGYTEKEELGKALDALYTKNVPAGVREFIELRAGLTPASASTPKAKKPKPSAPSAVGEVPAAQEVSSHEQH